MATFSRPIQVDQRSAIRNLDWTLLGSAALLLFIGLVSLFSIGHRDGEPYLKKQVAMAVIGLVPFALFFFAPADLWRRFASVLYGLNVIMLAAVLKVGSSANGAQRWIDLKFMQFQPSELAKLLVVLTLSSFLVARADQIKKPSTFLLSFLHVGVPAVLIALQPHYGGALVLVVIWLGISLAAGVPFRFIACAVILLGFAAVLAVKVPGAFHGYHLKRLKAMARPDKSGASWQQDRAQVALAAGGIFGTGLGKGTQHLPEQQNDFIFTVLGEELGLAGCTLILTAFGFFFYRLWLAFVRTKDLFGRAVIAGILSLLAIHTMINIGMVIGLFPVIGLWLPFMSAGGSSLWLCMACVALALNLRRREKALLF